ncbi:MAG: LysR family transcriptional regulator [Rickettsiales bacterium]|nr:LysR family transcriptional regulator [Rickettsiales bacterium]
MDWDKLRTFYTVAQSKSLTKAGEALSLSQSAVSRQITSLESRLGVSLFHRHARGLVLTEQGDTLFRTVSEMVVKLQTAESTLAETAARPKGPFTITAPSAFGTIWLTPAIKEFNELYPDINITLLLDDREMDLSMREADVAIRLYPSKNPDLIQKPLVTMRNSIYASNDYLRLYGIPKDVDELKYHKLIAFKSNTQPPFPKINWLFNHPQTKKMKLKPALTMNCLQGMRTAVKEGMGIAALPDYLLYRGRHVSKVLDTLEGPLIDTYLVYPLELKNSTRVGAFRSFLTRKLAEYNF